MIYIYICVYIYIYVCVYIYIYILVRTCAYPCTEPAEQSYDAQSSAAQRTCFSNSDFRMFLPFCVPSGLEGMRERPF